MAVLGMCSRLVHRMWASRLRRGAEQNFAEAPKWITGATEQGGAGAQKNLGIMYNNGMGVWREFVAALKWDTEALEQGLMEA